MYETYDGNHINRIAARLEKKVLPFFAGNLLGNPEKGSLPSKQEKVMVAESAPVGQHNPAKSSFEGISAAYASKLNGPAMRAAHRKHSGEGSIHY